jgi:plastocyanin
VLLDHVLRYNVVTPTLALWGAIQDTAPVTATPAFAADGYHLTSASAAIDAGVNASVNDDIDGGPRPLGTAPDIGADESPYSLADTGVQVSKLADAPQWKVYYTGLNVPPSTYFEQNYLMPFAYYSPITAPQVTAYSIRDDFPSELELTAAANPIDLSYVRSGQTLTWTSRAPLAPGDWGWVGLTSQSETVLPDQIITNRGQLIYSLANGQTHTVLFSATTIVPPRPVFPPVLITPLDGEMCLEAGNQLSAHGVAGAGMIAHLYEDGSDRAQMTAKASGEFTLTWTSALTLTHPSINIYTVACTPDGTCSTPSRTVSLSYPQADWCPQRSYWEGDVNGFHHIFYFRNDQGRYASNDFVLPGIYGFHNTQMHLFSCCDHNDTNPFKVTADGVVYTTPSAHDGRWWTFTIGTAHTVIVESQCQGGGSPPPGHTTYGQVLIDPDGFIFDVIKGGSYDAQTGMFAPVQAVPGVTVTAYVSVPEWGGWIPWPAHLYNDQINPQVTGDDGYFAFFTPPGSYYLQVDGLSGYQSWRSPIIEVITQVVHVNVPYTPWADPVGQIVNLSYTDGPDRAVITIPVGSSVEWVSTLDATASVDDFTSFITNPILHLLSDLNPLASVLGWDGGMLTPGQTYRRQFATPGAYSYTDGVGHTGTVVVEGYKVYLPLVKK